MNFKDGFKAGLGYIAAKALVGLVSMAILVGVLVLLTLLNK